MEYKDFFNSALSEAFDKYTFSDADEMMKSIRERAERMDKNIVKRSRVFSIAAGTAAAVAVIGGSALGMSCLNEYGGLSEGGGAAYHESTPEAEIKDLLTAAGDRFVFGDTAAEIESVDYDGQFIRIKYTVEYTGGDDSYHDWESLVIGIDPDDYNALVLMPSGSYRDIDRISDNKIEKLFIGDLSLKNGETVKVCLEVDSPQLFEYTIDHTAVYTVTGVDKSGTTYTVNDADGNEWIILSPLGAKLVGPTEYGMDEDFSFALKFRDGETTEIIETMRGPCKNGTIVAMPGEVTDDWDDMEVEYLLPDPVDVNDIAAVIINGEEIPLNFYTGEKFSDGAEQTARYLADKGAECHVIVDRNETMDAGCVIRTEPEFGLMDELPESYELHLSSGSFEQNNFNVQYRTIGEPSGIPQIINFGYDGERAYIYLCSCSFDDFISEATAESTVDDSFIEAVSAYCDENGALNYNLLCDGSESFQIAGFLDNSCMSGVRYFRIDDKYVLGAKEEDATAFVLVDAETGGAELYGVHTDYNGIRHILNILRVRYSGFPYVYITVVEDLGTGDVTLEISVSEEERPALEQFLTDNNADLSLCRFMKLFTF